MNNLGFRKLLQLSGGELRLWMLQSFYRIMSTLITSSLCFAVVAGSGAFASERLGQPSEKERRLVHSWQDFFWVPNAQPKGLEEHRRAISGIRSGQGPGYLGKFAVNGHEIVAGVGIVLVLQKFSYDPDPENFILLPDGKEVSQSRFWKLLIYLPDELPAEGTRLQFDLKSGNNNDAFALLTRGALTDMNDVCFGYAENGSVSAVVTKKRSGTVSIIGLDKDSPVQEVELEHIPGLSGHNVILDIRVEFQMHSSSTDSPFGCGNVAPLQEGVMNRFWFEKRNADDLPWGGRPMGPLDVQPSR